MPLADIPLHELKNFLPSVEEPADFDTFWAETISEARRHNEPADLRLADSPFTELKIYDLTFPGFGGEPIRAWVSRPLHLDDARPAIVQFQGYGGGRGQAGENVVWALAGYTHVFVDTRGQGSNWGGGGHTADPHGSGPAASGMMTRGIESPFNYYYRRVFADSVRAVDATRQLPFVDSNRVAVAGASQGGGIALAVAAIAGDVAAVLADCAFLCAIRRGAEIAVSGPYLELATYLSVHRDALDDLFRTLSYFDGVNFARRISAPSLFSVALMDTVVPPSTTFAAYNYVSSPDRSIEVYPFNNHEGGGSTHFRVQASWLRSRLAV